jgi:hypothetical protein
MNLVCNQHDIFTFRKYLGQNSIRVSLRTSNKDQAKQIYFRVQERLIDHPILSPAELKLIVHTIVDDYYGQKANLGKRQLLESLKRSLEEVKDDQTLSTVFGLARL